MTDELIELKERVDFLGYQLEEIENEFEIALRTGESSKAKITMKKLIFEAQSTKEFTEALLSKYWIEGKEDKVNFCLNLLRYLENIENVISLQSCSFILL